LTPGITAKETAAATTCSYAAADANLACAYVVKGDWAASDGTTLSAPAPTEAETDAEKKIWTDASKDGDVEVSSYASFRGSISGALPW
jgi:hypothetical protein